MKVKIICFLLPLFLLSCSKKPTDANGTQSQNQSVSPPTSLPFKVTVVETPEEEEINDISNQAAALLSAKDYDKLDELAKKYRDSRESYADGTWKLFNVYNGLNLSVKASDAEWTDHFSILRDWINARPNSITARVAMSQELVNFAWKARGGDYANTVSDENWKLFFQRLNEAVDVLNAAKILKEQCPYMWSVLLQAELGLQVDRSKYDATFNAATKAWPDYTPYYFRRVTYLMPRWNGTAGELENDLGKSADKIGGEDGDMLYAQVVWYAHQWFSSTNIFKEYNLSWNRVNTGLEIIEKHFPDSLAVKNEAARLAVLASDEQSAKKYFDQTQGKVDLDCWESQDDYVRFADLVYGCTQ
jgi:hypothetical protein